MVSNMKGDELLEGLIKERQDIMDRRKKLQDQLISLDVTIESYCCRHNICLDCRGLGEVYQPSRDTGDPNHRSSDDRHSCIVCGGNGKYKGGN